MTVGELHFLVGALTVKIAVFAEENNRLGINKAKAKIFCKDLVIFAASFYVCKACIEEVIKNKDIILSEKTGGEVSETTTESRERTPEVKRERQPVEETSVANFGVTPKLSDEQLVMPGVRQKPKSYKLEQDTKYNAPPTTLLERRADDPSQYGQDYEEKSHALENVLSSFNGTKGLKGMKNKLR